MTQNLGTGRAYDAIGRRFVDSQWSFIGSSSGWRGLSDLGTNLKASD